MPATDATLDRNVESFPQYRERCLRWALYDLLAEGEEVTPEKLRERARIPAHVRLTPPDWLDALRSTFTTAEDSDQSEAA
jgi:hypothetical protein